jgi:hypothetical protein
MSDNGRENEGTEVISEQIEKWKKQFGPLVRLDFSATCPDAVFVCRLPSFTEIKVANEAADIGATENLARKCVLAPGLSVVNELLNRYPGLFNSIARELLARAGWSAAAVAKNL